MIDLKTKEPYICVWMGNFFRPAYDDPAFVDEAISLLKEDGFNSIMLDSKAWKDFRDRYDGGDASQYVKMQEYMQERILDNGLSYTLLALYMNGDNLYPDIRFSPPIYGESITNPDGSDGRWYKYWSAKAKDSMIDHVRGLYKLYGKGFNQCRTKSGDVKEPLCSMWDPMVMPSFDSEGQTRYLNWLRAKYKSIDELNQNYGTNFTDFDKVLLQDVWFTHVYEEPHPSREEFDSGDPAARIWVDNMSWRRDELCEYFKDMQERLKQISPTLFTCPDMAQWSYFLNIDSSVLADVDFNNLWDTANRGNDFYRSAKEVDCGHFTTVPVTPWGDPDPYVTACQHSMMRAMNPNRDFIGGIYWGRFLYNDIYQTITPCEIIGTMVGAGIDGYSSYGMCGMDDGGMLQRMSNGFHQSLKLGNRWAKQVIPRLGERKKQIAILFPAAMSLFEPMGVSGNKERRHDLLGWYKMCSDFGYMVDVIHPDALAYGALNDYAALILPENDCYIYDPSPEAEDALKRWVENGGIVLASPGDEMCRRTFGICGHECSAMPIWYGEGGNIQSTRFMRFTEGESLVRYCKDIEKGSAQDDFVAVSAFSFGKGTVYAFGFDYGYSYSAKIAPHVLKTQKNNALYPVPLMKKNILDDIFVQHGVEKASIWGQNIEVSVFSNGIVIVNHNSYPIEIVIDGEKLFQYPLDERTLSPRSAVLVEIE